MVKLNPAFSILTIPLPMESSTDTTQTGTAPAGEQGRVWFGTGGGSYLAMSVWEFSSPSTVKGEPPVSSSYIRTPRLHQSTAWSRDKAPIQHSLPRRHSPLTRSLPKNVFNPHKKETDENAALQL